MGLADLLRRGDAVMARAFGETVTYRNAGLPGGSKEIKAVVDRDPITAQGEDSRRTVARPLEIEILREDVPAVSPKVDAVLMSRVVGEEAVWLPVSSILGQDESVWRLAVGR